MNVHCGKGSFGRSARQSRNVAPSEECRWPKRGGIMRRKLQAGTSLIEGLISILIFSVGVLGLAQAQLIYMANSRDAQFRTEAVLLASELANLAAADPENAPCYGGGACDDEDAGQFVEDWEARLAAVLPNAEVERAYDENTREFSIEVTWQRKNDSDVRSYSIATTVAPGGV